MRGDDEREPPPKGVVPIAPDRLSTGAFSALTATVFLLSFTFWSLCLVARFGWP